MKNRGLGIVVVLLLLLAAAGIGFSFLLSPLPQPLVAILFPPTVTPTSTPTATPTSTPTPTHTPTPTPTPTPEPLSVTLLPYPLQPRQGGTVAIEVQANREVEVTGDVGDRPLNFVEWDGSYWALVGFPSWSRLGPQDLIVEATSAAGEVVRVTETLTITYRQFPTEIIDIPSEREYLLDPAITRAEAERLAEIYGRLRPEKLWQDVFGYPVQELTITSAYGALRQYDTGPGCHAGVDLDGEQGDPVFAAADGRVVLAEVLQVRGGAVVLDHGLGVYSCYFHLSDMLVQEGQVASKGQVIGYMGSSGLSTGTHLHWEIRVGGTAVDPFEWTRRRMLTSCHDQSVGIQC